MSVEVRQLRYFVADELNFTRAAQQLNVVQQSLSTAIAQSETMLDIKLFERSTRTVALTDAGAAWLPYARQALATVDRADVAARDLAAGRAGRLRVGLASTAALDLTPKLLRAFTDRHPLVELVTEHFDRPRSMCVTMPSPSGRSGVGRVAHARAAIRVRVPAAARTDRPAASPATASIAPGRPTASAHAPT
jgi:DNA-binding transcriptional LysR family regulator